MEVELVRFPANPTSITQPLDQGVIYRLKLHYRTILMQSLLESVETQDKLSGIVKFISVLDAINWITMILKNVDKLTKLSDKEIDLRSKEEELSTTLNFRNENLREFITVDDTAAEEEEPINQEVEENAIT
ncbi:DDE superfamily endonuclease [Popillia japonica]|uniref:DDE superfamily endonuclease n=1 Tax=Popillia japonica TaxID=7064 RepID=A0AAW1JJC1_POPJA